MTVVIPPKPIIGDFYYSKRHKCVCRMSGFYFIYVPAMTYYGMTIGNNFLCTVYSYKDCEYKSLFLEELIHYSQLSTLQKYIFDIPLDLGE